MSRIFGYVLYFMTGGLKRSQANRRRGITRRRNQAIKNLINGGN